MSKLARTPRVLHRTFKATVDDVDQDKRQIRSIITTDAIDRYGEVIIPKGIATKNFEANPIVLWQHSQQWPIGKCVELKRRTNTLVAITQFAQTEKAEEIFRLYVAEILNGWSIGARVDWKHYGAPSDAELKERPELKACYALIRKCELIEYSAVSIPANPEALGNEVCKSISAAMLREIEGSGRWEETRIPEAEELLLRSLAEAEPAVELPALVGRSFAEVLTEVRRNIGILVDPALAQRMIRDEVSRLRGSL